MRVIHTFFSIFFLLLSTTVFGQLDTLDKNGKYFDDGILSTPGNLISVDVISVAMGSLPISYERVFRGKFGLEVGVGAIFRQYIPDLFTMDSEMRYPVSGFSYSVQPKFYLGRGNLFESSKGKGFIGLPMRRRHYFVKNDQINYRVVLNEFGYGGGYNRLLGKRFFWGTDVYVAGGFIQYSDNVSSELEGTFGLNIKFLLGVIF